MNKNIKNLTKIFSKDLLSRFDFIDFEKKKINKKTIIFWLFLIVIISISFMSYKVIRFLKEINQATIFLNGCMMIISFIIVFQTIIICANNYYFSYDLNLLLPLPIKPKDILTAKFITIVLNIYLTELVFFLFPMIIYGIMTFGNLLYYIFLMFTLVIFPILPTLMSSIIISVLIKFSRFIKNKNFFQILITSIFMISVFFVEFKITNFLVLEKTDEITEKVVADYIINFDGKIQKGNSFFIQVNDIVNMLKNSNPIECLKIIKIACIDIILFLIFIFCGNKYYIKDILRNNNFNKTNERQKNNNIKISRKKNKKISYFIKEIKMLIRNPTFFIQCVFPTISLFLTAMLITISFAPQVREFLKSEVFEDKMQINYDIKIAGAMMILTQIIFTISNISITGISREGKNAKFMKNLPIKLYDQFMCKSYVQVLINSVFLFAIVLCIHKILLEIKLIDLIFLFILFILINIINSKLMLLIDLINPNLNWDAEHEINKNNKNKIFQYAFTIYMIVFITYLSKILDNINIIMSYLVFADCLILTIFIINFVTKLMIKKLFNRIE